MKKQRLDKFIATQLNIPRAMAKTQIHRGKVTVGDTVVRDPSLQVDPDESEISYKGEKVAYSEFVYIVMNKPEGTLCATHDSSARTVLDILPPSLKRKDLSPVGRLDKDTTGLLLLTDDGAFAHRVISPSKTVGKTYVAVLDGTPDQNAVEVFRRGVVLADGTRCKPAVLKITGENIAEITITEGKYHQIKRMFGTVGLGVNELSRISIGTYTLPPELAPGECRRVTGDELDRLFSAVLPSESQNG